MEHRKDLHGQQQTADSTRQKRRPDVTFPGAAVGSPPKARLVAQAAQDGIQQAAQLGRGDHAAQHACQQQRHQRVGIDGEPHTKHERQCADQRQQTRQVKGHEVTAQNLEKAGGAFFAGGVRRDTGAGAVEMEIEQSHGGFSFAPGQIVTDLTLLMVL